MLSLCMRWLQQSALTQKLRHYKKHNATMLALADYNRIFQYLPMLAYPDEQQLRQVIQELLCRGERLQGLIRALAALGGNQFRGRTPEEMAMWNSCSNLLANCIVYYNAKIMSLFKSDCLATGKPEQRRLRKIISPASWENVILNGFYDLTESNDEWDIESQIARLEIAA